MEALREIEVLIRAKYPIVLVSTWEERRVEAGLTQICSKLKRSLHTWSITQGLKPSLANTPPSTKSLPGELEVLAQVHEAPEHTVFMLRDFHPYLKDSRVIRLLRDLSGKLRGKAQTLILTGPVMTLPIELEKDVTVLEFPLPVYEEIEDQLNQVLAAVKDTAGVDSTLDPEHRELIIKSAQGLTLDEIESAFARSIVEERKITVERIIEEKKQIVRKSGILEFYPATTSLADVGGHDLLKDWLERREKAFTDKAKDFGIQAPKGVLLLGVQGCGKSLIARGIASSWNLPMLKMDVGRIFGSLVGQSEENIRKAIRVAESVAPCVLWADELEKGFAGVGSSGVSDSGTTARVFATFLTWMQEKTKAVFLIATANDVSSLPPELLRKGRFDDIFFIDLPEKAERKQILTIHLKKRKRDPKKFKLPELVELTKGFSGAEIEQAIVGALYQAFDDNRELKQSDITEEIKASVPLSVMMAEEIDELRTWAQMRTRPSAKRTGEIQL